jgi:hypothetical protein
MIVAIGFIKTIFGGNMIPEGGTITSFLGFATIDPQDEPGTEKEYDQFFYHV